MATYTTNYELAKPAYSDQADIGVINGDLDAIDAQMKTNADAAASAMNAATEAQRLAGEAREAADNKLGPESPLPAENLTGTVPTSCLPAYVDDVVEYANKAAFPATGEAGKIYVDLATNLAYRWGGSAYVEISPSIALGETSGTAYRGDRGAAAYAHGVTNKGNALTGKPTGNQTPAFGGTFQVSQVVTNAEGHVTGMTDRTVTIPNAEASASAAGLMSASDKLLLGEHEYDNQVACNTYAGRSIAALFPDEVAAAGTVWQFLHTRIAARNFSGLRIGDWFDVPLTSGAGKITQASVRYVIGAFDHYFNCSDQAIGHHIVCVPQAPVSMAGSSYAINTSYIHWNTTATNQGTADENNPYLVSNLHDWEINEFLTMLPSTLQSLLLNHRSLCESRYSASGNLNASTSWAWKSLGKIWSPSEMEVYGCRVWGTAGWSQGMDSQFPYFRETKNRIAGGRVYWWLRVVSGVSASNVCYVYYNGNATNTSATDTWIRPLPCFLLG